MMINYSAAWKTIESMCLKSNLLFIIILLSNCRINNMKIRNLLFLSLSKTMIITAKNILLRFHQVNNNDRFMWINKKVKYQSKPLLIEEVFDAGIYDFYQLLKPYGSLTLMTKLLRLLDLKGH